MNVVVYTTSTCPRCKILKDKLMTKNIDFVECQDVERMSNLGITEVPKLEKEGKILSFGEAVAWINSL